MSRSEVIEKLRAKGVTLDLSPYSDDCLRYILLHEMLHEVMLQFKQKTNAQIDAEMEELIRQFREEMKS